MHQMIRLLRSPTLDMYAPSSDSERRLLAHEVAHVVQQSAGKEPSIATESSHRAKIGAADYLLVMLGQDKKRRRER
jgi:hypothetical protein